MRQTQKRFSICYFYVIYFYFFSDFLEAYYCIFFKIQLFIWSSCWLSRNSVTIWRANTASSTLSDPTFFVSTPREHLHFRFMIMGIILFKEKLAIIFIMSQSMPTASFSHNPCNLVHFSFFSTLSWFSFYYVFCPPPICKTVTVTCPSSLEFSNLFLWYLWHSFAAGWMRFF